MDEVEENSKTYSDIPTDQRTMLEEALSLVQDGSSGTTGVARVQTIFATSPGLKEHINIHFPQIYGETLLSNAVRHSFAMVKVLLDAGADPNVGNTMDGETPIEALLLEVEQEEDLEGEDKKILKLLKQHGAKPSPSVEDQMKEAIKMMLHQ